MPGTFKLGHLQPIKPLLFSDFYTFFTFILGGQFLLPQRANIAGGGPFLLPHFFQSMCFAYLLQYSKLSATWVACSEIQPFWLTLIHFDVRKQDTLNSRKRYQVFLCSNFLSAVKLRDCGPLDRHLSRKVAASTATGGHDSHFSSTLSEWAERTH